MEEENFNKWQVEQYFAAKRRNNYYELALVIVGFVGMLIGWYIGMLSEAVIEVLIAAAIGWFVGK